jgi:PAS domain S-box-containing protein
MPTKKTPALTDADIVLSFHLAPVGLCVSRNRVIQRCNEAFATMFGYTPELLCGVSFECLYPSHAEFELAGERILPIMREFGSHSDERIMRRKNGQLFWCHVSGQSLNPSDPYACCVWMFEDISTRRPMVEKLTIREREIAQQLLAGRSSKQIAKAIGIL